MRRELAVLVTLTLGCRIAAPDAAAPQARPEPSPTPTAPGQTIDVAIPLCDGDVVRLSELRGAVVVLDLADSDVAGWEAAQTHFRGLVGERGADDLVVVSVATDPDRTRFPAAWNEDPPPFVLGRDPQAAVALRLGVANLPSLIVIDKRGRVVGKVSGYAPGNLAAVSAWVATARGP